MTAILIGRPAEAADRMVLDAGSLERMFREIVIENAPWPSANLHLDNISFRPASLLLPAGTVSRKLLNPFDPAKLGKKVLTVAVLVNGREEARVLMTGDLGLYGDVICAKHHLKRNTVLTTTDLVTVRRDITMLGTGVIGTTDRVIGQRLTTSLQPGNIIYADLLDTPVLVKRGDLVTIMAKRDGIQITVPGEVKNAGAQGEMIKVKNLMSRREVAARVVGSDTVAVDF